MAFVPNDSSVYLTGVEDGVINKCSVAYSEQALETYNGHTAAVYSLRFSPFLPDIFLSCSADWTVRLWDHQQTEALFAFQPSELSDVVRDVAWSPHHPEVFASVTGDGSIYIWDLARSLLEPILTVHMDPATEEVVINPTGKDRAGLKKDNSDNDENNRNYLNKDAFKRQDSSYGETPTSQRAPRGAAAAATTGAKKGLPPPRRPTQMTTVGFSETCPVLATGTSRGVVEVYRLSGMDMSVVSKEEGAKRLKAALSQRGAQQ